MVGRPALKEIEQELVAREVFPQGEGPEDLAPATSEARSCISTQGGSFK